MGVEQFFLRLLRPGDVLLYHPVGFWGKVIAWKTWSDVSHVEVYIGHGNSVAARDGLGVACYPLRTSDIAYVLRPKASLDLASAFAWFGTVDGQPYDWLGLLVFEGIRRHGNPQKQYCSNFATRFLRHAGIDLFGEGLDADSVAPATFLASPAFTVFWRSHP